MGMIVDRQDGMEACVRKRLKIVVKTCANWSAQPLSTFPGTPSGPVAFLGLTFQSSHLGVLLQIVRGHGLKAWKEGVQHLPQLDA